MRKGPSILLFPVLATLVSVGVASHQYMRRNALRAELKHTRSEFSRLVVLLPAKYKPKVAEVEDAPHDNHSGSGHKH